MSGGIVSAGHAAPFSHIPSVANQASFFATGAFAGTCTLPVEFTWSWLVTKRPPPISSILHATPIYRAGVRFWIFDIARSALQTGSSSSQLPLWAKGGLAGAAGGFSEVCVQAALNRKLPGTQALLSQSGRLFLCFGSYTYLSNTLSEESPPRPFWRCWLMGAAAGAFGNAIVAAAEGARGAQLWRVALPKGGLVIGTVISTQVTSCRKVLDLIDE